MRWAMHPVTPMTTSGRSRFRALSCPTRPRTRCSACSRMAQVFTSTTSASSGEPTISYPSAARTPSMSSPSEMFIWHPYVST